MKKNDANLIRMLAERENMTEGMEVHSVNGVPVTEVLTSFAEEIRASRAVIEVARLVAWGNADITRLRDVIWMYDLATDKEKK